MTNKYTPIDISNVYGVPLKDVLVAIKTLGLSQPLTKEEVDSVVAHLGDKIPPREKVYTKDEAAKKLGITKDTLLNKLKKGELKGDGLSNILASSVLQYLQQPKNKGGRPPKQKGAVADAVTCNLNPEKSLESEVDQRTRQDWPMPEQTGEYADYVGVSPLMVGIDAEKTSASLCTPIETNQMLNPEETKELDGEVKREDPFGYFDDIPLLKPEKVQYVTLENAIALAKQAAKKAYDEGYKAGVESIEVVEIANIGDLSGFGGVG